MSVLVNAIKNGNVAYDNGAAVIETTYNLGDGNHNVNVSGSKTNVITGDGINTIKQCGNDAYIQTGNGTSHISTRGNNLSIKTGDGTSHICHVGDNASIETGDGDDEIVFIGDNVNLKTNGGNDSVDFWGNNCNISTGDGNDSVTTFDQVYTKSKYAHLSEDFLNRLESKIYEIDTLKASELIDAWSTRTWYGKNRKTYVYERLYEINKYLSHYVDGVKDTTVDLGSGSNTANVTFDSGSTIVTPTEDSVTGETATNNITYNKAWQIDEKLDTYNETRLEYEKKSSWDPLTIVGWGLVGLSFLTANPLMAQIGGTCWGLGASEALD